MCVECWEDAGSPTIWNERVERALELIRAIYAANAAGGPLHVHLDDWNIDIHIEPWGDEAYWADEYADKEIDGADLWQWSVELAELLNSMPEDERISALAFHDGFATPPTTGGTT